jgi:hypothetical protein
LEFSRVTACGFFVLAALVALQPATAASQTVAPPAPPSPNPPIQQSSEGTRTENTGDDVDRPVNLFQLLYGYRTAPGAGASRGTLREVTTDTINLRMDRRIELGPQWRVGLRADLPLLAKDPISVANPAGDYRYGVGDADFQAALIHDFDERWTAGLSARLVAPTGDDFLGSGKWQILPGIAIRYALPDVSAGSYLEPFVRYAVSFAGDPSKRNISNLQIAPTLNVSLPNRWFVTFYPSADIRVNYGDPVTGQTGRLFLPFDARVGRKLTDDLTVSLEIGVPIVKAYPVYDFKTEVRLNLLF